MSKLVCSTSNKLCMVHRCSECPGKNALIEHLKNELPVYEHEYEYFDDELTFQQWQSTDRTTIVTVTQWNFRIH